MNGNTDRQLNKWFRITLISLLVVLLVTAVANILVDPFFHFHKPFTKYRLNDEKYINDGIARHFDYDAIISGNSLSQNFKPSQVNELFGTEKCIKLTYSGASYNELWQAMGRNLSYQDKAKMVIVGVDLDDLSKRPGWRRYDSYPEYMYDDNVLNDIKYIFNKDVLYRGTLYNLLYTVTGNDCTNFDEYSAWVRPSGPEEACATLDKVTEPKPENRELNEDSLNNIKGNIEDNIGSVLAANRDTKFVLIIPPSSIAKWAEYRSKGEICWRIDGLEYALSMLLKEENAEVYAFDDAFEITTDLSRYCDTIHYDAGVNEWILNEVAAGKHRITSDNYEEYISSIKNFYDNYDYLTLNQYIKE